MKDIIEIWCDGGSRHNGKPHNIGGWAYLLSYKRHILSKAGHAFNTTNNAQELTALINALKQIKTTHIPIVVYSDSQYVIKGLTEWRKGWEARGWVNTNKKPVANKELWIELFSLHDKQDMIEYKWVKGHSDNEGNNFVDKLLNEEMDRYS